MQKNKLPNLFSCGIIFMEEKRYAKRGGLMQKYVLYGDGMHDDTAAIQEMIDSGVCEVSLPAPKNFYLISKPLVIPSNFKL